MSIAGCTHLIAIAGLSTALNCFSQPQYLGPWIPPGIEVINKSTKATYPTTSPQLATLEIAPLFLANDVSAGMLLQANGVEPERLSIDAVKQLNLNAFKGDVATAGQVVYLPKPKFFNAIDQQTYSIKFTEPNLFRIQLHSDAQSIWQLAEAAKALPRDSSGVQSHLVMLQGVANDLFRLGNVRERRFSGSELAVVSFSKEMIEHLSQEFRTKPGGARVRTLALIHEAASFISTIANAATSPTDTRIGRRVTVAYELSKKPVHGLRLYALPLGMRNNPSEFTEGQIRRALEMHAFETLTSPSSKILPFANYSVIAGPAQISRQFLARVQKDQVALDFQTVAVTNTRQADIEFILVARNPKQ